MVIFIQVWCQFRNKQSSFCNKCQMVMFWWVWCLFRKKTEVLFAANGEVLVSVMSISEKTKSLLQQMVMFWWVWCLFQKGEVLFATNDPVYTSLMSISKQTKSLSPSLRLHCPLTKSWKQDQSVSRTTYCNI